MILRKQSWSGWPGVQESWRAKAERISTNTRQSFAAASCSARCDKPQNEPQARISPHPSLKKSLSDSERNSKPGRAAAHSRGVELRQQRNPRSPNKKGNRSPRRRHRRSVGASAPSKIASAFFIAAPTLVRPQKNQSGKALFSQPCRPGIRKSILTS